METGATFALGLEHHVAFKATQDPVIARHEAALALEAFQQAHANGNEDASYYVGLYLLTGIGTTANREEERRILEDCASRGHPEALYELGVILFKENRVDEARVSFEAAIAANNGDGYQGLWVIMLNTTSFDESQLELLECGVKMGSAAACNGKGFIYSNDTGPLNDLEQALKYYTIGIERGHAGSCCNLAHMFDTGQGVEQNYEKAVRLYSLGIERGDAHSCFNLAIMYANGRGVRQNFEEAVRLYTLGIERGNPESCFNLALMYNDGTGVEQNYEEAFRLYMLGVG